VQWSSAFANVVLLDREQRCARAGKDQAAFRSFISFTPVVGVLQSLQNHPSEHQYRFEHTNCPFNSVGRVLKFQSHLA
jgi:hypothetical protein